LKVHWRLALLGTEELSHTTTLEQRLCDLEGPTTFTCELDTCIRFCDFIGDDNPVHRNIESARSFGMNVIAIPGTLLTILGLTAIGHHAPIDGYSVKFHQWAQVGEALEIRPGLRRGTWLMFNRLGKIATFATEDSR
jgi:hypothetical protein